MNRSKTGSEGNTERTGGGGRRETLAYLRHELRTPLNTIIGYGQVLQDEAVEDGREKPAAAFARIMEDSRRLLEIVEEFLRDLEEGGNLDPPGLKRIGAELRKAVNGPISAIIIACANLIKAGQGFSSPDLRRMYDAAEDFLAFIHALVTGRASSSEKEESETLAREAIESIRSADRGERPEEVRGGRVLAVDDSRVNRQVLTRHLERQGYQADTAADGRQALEMAASGSYDVILLDIMMPVMNGIEVLQKLREDDQLRDVPVIMISALDEMESVVRCIEMGADDFLAKPFNPHLLQARLSAGLDKKRLRDKEKDYLANVALLTEAAAEVESARFDPESLAHVAERQDALGRLARVFQNMAREVYAREQKLKEQVRELHIELNEARQATQVAEITESEYFVNLRDKAQDLRRLLDDDEE